MLLTQTFYSAFKINLFNLNKLHSENIGLNWTSEFQINSYEQLRISDYKLNCAQNITPFSASEINFLL